MHMKTTYLDGIRLADEGFGAYDVDDRVEVDFLSHSRQIEACSK